MRSAPFLLGHAAERVVRVLRQRMFAHVPVVASAQGTRGARPWRQAQPQSRGAFCSISVGDLCMAVQVVRVPCPHALSMMACCSDGSSPWSLAACTASVADKILDCSFAWGMSRATLLGGTWSVACTGAALGLDSYTFLASHSSCTPAWSSTATPAVSKAVFAAKASVSSRCLSECCLCSALHMFGMMAMCSSTADQYVACAANPNRATHKPKPPKHVGSLAFRHTSTKQCRHRLSEPVFWASLQRGQHQRWDQPEVVVQGVRHPVAASTPSRSSHDHADHVQDVR